MAKDFEIAVPIKISEGRKATRGVGDGKKIGEIISKQIERSLKSIGFGKGKDNTDSSFGGLSKNLKGVALKLGVIAGIAVAAIGVLKKASPYLKGILDIFGRAFMIFFRPFGDFLATLLRPLAILLMKMAVAFLKWTRGSKVGAGAVAGATGAVGGAIVGAGIGALGGPIGALGGAAIGAILGLLTQVDWGALKTAIINFIGRVKIAFELFVSDPLGFMLQVGENLKIMFSNFKSKINEAWTTFIDWLGTALPQFAAWFGEKIFEGLTLIINFIKQFGPWLWDTLVLNFKVTLEILMGFGKWLWDTITGALSNIWSSLSGIGNWILNSIKDSISRFSFGFIKGHQMGTPFVSETGLHLLHRGEQVIPRGQSQNKTVMFSPTFQINNAGINQDIDLDSIVRRAGRINEMELKQRGII